MHTSFYNQYYLDNQFIEGSFCLFYRINENGKITPVSECEKDDKTNLPKKDCVYMEGASGTFGSFTGSLMVEPNTKVDSPLEVFSDNSNHNKEVKSLTFIWL